MGEAKCDLYEHTEAYILAPVVDSLNTVLRGAGLPECERSDLQEIRDGLVRVEVWGHRVHRADPLKADLVEALDEMLDACRADPADMSAEHEYETIRHEAMKRADAALARAREGEKDGS